MRYARRVVLHLAQENIQHRKQYHAKVLFAATITTAENWIPKLVVNGIFDKFLKK